VGFDFRCGEKCWIALPLMVRSKLVLYYFSQLYKSRRLTMRKLVLNMFIVLGVMLFVQDTGAQQPQQGNRAEYSNPPEQTQGTDNRGIAFDPFKYTHSNPPEQTQGADTRGMVKLAPVEESNNLINAAQPLSPYYPSTGYSMGNPEYSQPNYPLSTPYYPSTGYSMGNIGYSQPNYPSPSPYYLQGAYFPGETGYLPPPFVRPPITYYPPIIINSSSSFLELPLPVIQGMRGEFVKRIQAALLQNGFNPGEIDGIYGEQTCNAVKTFQMTVGLIPTGEVGMETIQVLGLDLTQHQAPTHDVRKVNKKTNVPQKATVDATPDSVEVSPPTDIGAIEP
jgi:hypothetical protein